MTKFRAVGAVLVAASGVMLAAAGAASAAEVAAVEPVARTGSASILGGVLDSIVSGSGGSGSSFSIKVGNGDVAGTLPSTGSAGTGSAGTGSAAMCVTNPTAVGCPKL
ncbi:hypothetical protein [Nocardia altamirensis]|uniref:hypothetical protein n=1 Tax=Nocardia altamirensis TaxID=472158 RepID=UPI000840743E|nr:hypothetical protein [Nocardia altamirensis]